MSSSLEVVSSSVSIVTTRSFSVEGGLQERGAGAEARPPPGAQPALHGGLVAGNSATNNADNTDVIQFYCC